MGKVVPLEESLSKESSVSATGQLWEAMEEDF